MSTARTDLMRFLTELPGLDDVQERKALIDFAGYPHIGIYLTWSGSRVQFTEALIDELSRRGQRFTAQFIQDMANAPQVSVDRQATLESLQNTIEALPASTWQQEFPVEPLTDQDRTALVADLDMLAATVVSTMLLPYYELGADEMIANAGERAAEIASKIAECVDELFDAEPLAGPMLDSFKQNPKQNEASLLKVMRFMLGQDDAFAESLAGILTAELAQEEVALHAMVNVSQNIRTVQGDVVGAIVGDDVLRSIDVKQDIGTVESGATVIGAVIGKLVNISRAFFVGDVQSLRLDLETKVLLAERVRDAWIDGDQSPLRRMEETFESLAGSAQPYQPPRAWLPDLIAYSTDADDVSDTLFGSPRRQTTDQPSLIASETTLEEIFKASSFSLLIAAAPGGGKSIALLELARALLTHAEAEEYSAPVPVVLTLSKWEVAPLPIDEWVVQELATLQYGIPTELGQRWLAQGQLALLFDNMDHLSNGARARCVEALNAFVHAHGTTPIAVACQLNAYQSLPEKLSLRRAILLQPLTEIQLDAFFDAAGSQLVGLRTLMAADPDLVTLLRAPMMLNLFSLTYREMSVQSPLPINAGTVLAHTSQDLRSRLIDTFVQRRLPDPTSDERYTGDQIMHWLGWLAQAMTSHNETMLHIERMQPGWMTNRRSQQLYLFLSRLFVGIVGGILGGFFIGLARALAGDPYGFARGFAEGLVGGLVTGPILALLSWLWITRIDGRVEFLDRSPRASAVIKIATFAIATTIGVAITFTLVFGVAEWLSFTMREWFIEGALVGFLFGLSSGLLFVFGDEGTEGDLGHEIKVPHYLNWSLTRGRRWGFLGAGIGLVAGSLVGWSDVTLLSQMVEQRFDQRLTATIALGVIGMVVFTLIGLVFGGLQGSIMPERKLTPNFGLRQALCNVAVTAPIIGVFFALVGLLLGVLLVGWNAGLTTWALTAYGGFIGVLAIFGFGALYLLKHLALRLVLRWNDLTPPLGQLADFLNDATRRMLLERVGGGFAFFHASLLQPYFAERFTQSTPEQKPES